MTSTPTLAEVRLAARQRADMENSQFLTNAEWNENISNSYFELYDLLVQKFGNDYFVAEPVTITADGTTERYALPNGTLYNSAPAFYKLLGVDVQVSGKWRALRPFNFNERNRLNNGGAVTSYGALGLRYRLAGEKVWVTPTPASGTSLRLWYVPRLTPPTADATVMDGVSGWIEYVIVDAAIKALQKEESDCTLLLAQKQALIKRIEAAAENRDAGNPQTVTDVYAEEGGGYPGWEG